MPIVVTGFIAALFAVAYKYYSRKILKEMRENKVEDNFEENVEDKESQA